MTLLLVDEVPWVVRNLRAMAGDFEIGVLARCRSATEDKEELLEGRVLNVLGRDKGSWWAVVKHSGEC